jgi:hypothetical protein
MDGQRPTLSSATLGEFERHEKVGVAINDKTTVLTLSKPSRRNNGVSSALSTLIF